ncbi:hypothetical protein [Pseudoalteromonas sp. PB2-1]|uniref:hypothetical protein n=1 Tax=Pseudoalteromonas sp. PB2-1 TaxID=2907242 RepID=UPI003704B6EC
MTLPIGSGFYTGDIPGQYSRKNTVTDTSKAISDRTAEQKSSTEYVKSSPQAVVIADKFKAESQSYQQTIYDKPSSVKVSRAISTYTEFANLDRRAEVQSLIGVDVYA